MLVDPVEEFEELVKAVEEQGEDPQDSEELSKTARSDVREEQKLVDALSDESHLSHRKEYQKILAEQSGIKGGLSLERISNLTVSVSTSF